MTITSGQADNVRPEGVAVQKPKPTTVKFADWRHEKLVRLAAVERDTSRSAYIAEAAVKDARRDLNLSREADFQAWMSAQLESAA